MSNRNIKSDGYEVFRKFLEEACGIVLGEDKQYLVSSRLDHLLRELSLSSVGALVSLVKRTPGAALRGRIIDAMTTNETSWFRDGYPFEILKHVVLPEIAKKKTREIRIWSAACSSGQEPYSISITVQEFLRGHPGSLTFSQIVSTEISSSALRSAREGMYSQMALSRGLSPEHIDQFFVASDDHWYIKQEISDRIVFKELNLIDSFVQLGRFDVVFCRNVLIYFSDTVRADILRRLIRTLQPGGYLFLGGSESLGAVSDEFEVLKVNDGIVYRLKPHPG